MENFIIIKDTVKKVRKYNLTGRILEFKIKNVPQGIEPVSWIREAIRQVIDTATKDLQPTDHVGFSFCSKEFSRGEGWIRFRPAKEINYEDIWDVISSIYQSNSFGFDTNTFCLNVTIVKMPRGRGRQHKFTTYEEECVKRKGIVVIKNNDNLCLPRALVTAVAYVDKDPGYKKVRKDVGKEQLKRAQKLMEGADIQIPLEGAGVPELQKFQQQLKGYKIVVYQYGTKGRDVMFEGLEGEKNLNLIFHDGHYNVITSLTAAFVCRYYCENCRIPYDHKKDHRCWKSCPACQQTPPCENRKKITCNDCFRLFRNETCYSNHKKAGSLGKYSVCEQVKLCSKCLKVIKNDRVHTCGEIYCKICQSYQTSDHLCFIQVDKREPQLKDTLFIIFDFETRQEKQLNDGSFEHEVNLCVFKQFCDACRETEPWLCNKCGVTTQVLRINPLNRFVEYVLNQRKLFKKVIVVSHNGGGFDEQFILNKIIVETDLTPELIMRGTKIIVMQVGNVKFLDSLNYFPMPLSVLPKAFGLTELKKGYFPHLFNKLENEEYTGYLPPIKYYNPDNMMVPERKKFLEWYNQKVSLKTHFNFKNELIEYCKSDTTILFESCKLFQTQMLKTTNVDPFTEATTIASACNKVFRRNFLKPNTIGIIPKRGYRLIDIQSNIALKWLIWEEKVRNITIQYAGNGKEAVLNACKVDGYCEEINTVFEFQGCYFHGCPSCFKHQRDQPLHDNPNETLNQRYDATVAKIERLTSFKYKVEEIWECEFRKKMQENPEIEKYTSTHPIVSKTPLNPRDAFYGGRTGNCKTYYKTKKEETIKYIDVCSLYPWVCKYGKFPIEHPQVFIGHKECTELNLQETDGLIKCKILPPQNLYHPVLPKKMNNKLMFVLCQTCGETMNYEQCTHSEDQRALTGTWVIDEILKSLEKGYKVLEIFEIWKYQTIQFDPVSKTGGLFVEMMNKFIKLKQEASGWPAACETDETKNQYIEKFFIQEDIKLDFSAIMNNPGLRCQAKLMLNSFWGKFGQLEHQPRTKIINKSEEFFSMLTNPCFEINTVLPVNETALVVNYQFTEESFDPLSTVNVAIAAYVTAQARLKLYTYLEHLNERVLYYDTDSVIYISRPGEYEPPTGSFLGDMTDELEGYGCGSYIKEFASGGPKNYAYKVWSTTEEQEKVVCKVKGIKLTYATSQLVNFESIRDMILAESEVQPIVVTRDAICRTKLHEVVSKKEHKNYKTNSLKRKFLENYDSVPYGFKKRKYD